MTPTQALATALAHDFDWHPDDLLRVAQDALAALPDDAHLFTVDSLAAALHEDRRTMPRGCGDHTESYDDHLATHLPEARAVIKAAMDGGT